MSERTVTGQHDETAGPARGTVRATMSGGAGGLRAAMTGRVLEPTDDRYDTARAVWNAGIDRRPAVIAQCASAADVAAAVRFGTEQGLEIAVRGGAHSTAGAGVAEDGLVIDLSRLNDVTVDPLVARVRVGGGALLRDMDAATQAHGLAVPSGLVGHTGVGGLALGGGMGWLSRKCGLTVDNLLAAEIVAADGQIRRATAAENPDLFWAIRGGGGNFGVVTSFEFRAHGVGPIVQFGLFFWSADQGPEALQAMRDIISDLPRDVNVVVACLNAPPAPFVPEEHHLTPGYALLVTGFGSAEEHAAVAAALRARLAPLFEFVTPMPYVDLQQLLDEANAAGQFYYDKGTDLADLSDDVIAVVTDHMQRRNSPMSTALFYPLGGAFHRGRLLFDIETADLWNGVGPCQALHRATLHQVLVAGAGDVPIRWGQTPRTVTVDDDGVTVEFSDGGSDRYDLVLGADGLHSTVRRLVFDAPAPRPVGQYARRFVVTRPNATPVWSVLLGRNSSFLTIPIGDGQIYCYCDGPLGQPPPPRDLLAEYAEPVPALLDALDEAQNGNGNEQAAVIEEVVLDSWTHGPVLLIGDAAHATSPNMAQGAAMALEDALVLAESLNMADSIPGALAAHERRRRPRTDEILRQTHRRDRTRTLSPALRNLVLKRFGRCIFDANYRPLCERA